MYLSCAFTTLGLHSHEGSHNIILDCRRDCQSTHSDDRVTERTNLLKSETEAAKKWANRWGFLVTQRNQIEAEQEKLRNKCRLLTPEHLKVRPASPVSKYIQVAPSPAVPKTTQGLIGWRSGVAGLELERYGSSRQGKWSFLHQMKWPEDSID
ncbi:ciliary microtubule inner protein 1-like isoform X2 [Mobula birostris]|uniref:ciliary microtubule inner protein 1-like isoform X2 n=1 Tax=Mobula birostris TaxID=1983395 RepID=UPI003B27E6F4